MDRAKILALMKQLYPPISQIYTDEQLYVYIDLCMPIVANEGANLDVDQQELACACLSLYFATMSTGIDGAVSKKKIKDVEISYATNTSPTNKWKKMYDMIISEGDIVESDSVFYAGII